MYNRALAGLLLIVISSDLFAETALLAPVSPCLGVELNPGSDSERFILPNGAGLPEGSGDVAAGQMLYQQNCLACHGADGVGGMNDKLAGGHGSLTGDAPDKTVGSYWPYATTLFDYVRRAMPYTNPGSLNNDQTYALTAYLLYINGILPADGHLNAQTLPLIEMPNRLGFIRKF